VIEKSSSLRSWALRIGVQPKTLKRWLAEDLGMVLPRVARGSKVLIRESDIEIVLRKRLARPDWKLLRKSA
jgi:hypothetical protein